MLSVWSFDRITISLGNTVADSAPADIKPLATKELKRFEIGYKVFLLAAFELGADAPRSLEGAEG
jgi:hypothetical protein